MKQLWTLTALLAVAGAAQAAPKQCVDVRLSSEQLVLRGDVDVNLKVTVSNVCRHPVQVLAWQLPGDEIESRLFGVAPTDMMTFASVCATLVVVGLIACFVPARRAMRVDPAVALRNP